MSFPTVSCLCPTYGRFPQYGHLLSETVESFLRQDYPGPRELLILNDCPEQQLFCPYPNVRVINLSHRKASLGEKYNLMVWMASGEILLPWEDDDISLPHRISQAVDKLCPRGSFIYDYFNPQKSFYREGPILHKDHCHGVCHNASAFTREAWKRVGGYPHISGAQDQGMDQALRRQGRMATPLGDVPRDWSYIYCWGRGFHLSGSAHPNQAYALHGHKAVNSGEFWIEPAWFVDYLAEVSNLLV